MNDKYNKGNHVLLWNYKVGKKPPDEGILNCTACGRTWKCKDRANNMSKTVCKPIATTHNLSSQKAASSSASGPDVRRRLAANSQFLILHQVQVQPTILYQLNLSVIQTWNLYLQMACFFEKVSAEKPTKEVSQLMLGHSDKFKLLLTRGVLGILGESQPRASPTWRT